MSASSDGTNYLVGLENHQSSPSTISAQLLAPNGTKLGAPIPTGRSGIASASAFDGVNYLLIWEDDALGTWNGNTGWQVFGQFISKAGATVGAPFAISTVGIWFDGIRTMAYGQGKYLVTYTRLINPMYGAESGNRYIAGRMVSPDGSMGPEFRISSGNGNASEVAFDGNNFFVVWCEDFNDYEIRGRFVSPAGIPGTEISVNASLAPSDNPKALAFDGVNYMVVWNDEVGGSNTGTWDCFGQLVSPSGALVGGVITLTAEPGPQMVTSISFDGANYLASWTDMQNPSNWDLYGQFISRSGALIGGKITLSAAAGNQLGGVGFGNGKYMALINDGVVLGPGGISQADSVSGLFLAPLAIPQIQSTGSSIGVQGNRFGFNLSGPAGQVVVVEASSSPVGPAWVPVGTNTLTGSDRFEDSQWGGFGSRFYRVRTF